jgi:hypothetical protein
MKACPMISLFLLALLSSLLNLPGTEGFVVVQKPNSLIITVSLHPDQAKELEACALDLTKSYVVKSSSNSRRRSAKGGSPINAVIRRLWAAGYYPLEEDNNARQSAATGKTKALGSKKP